MRLRRKEEDERERMPELAEPEPDWNDPQSHEFISDINHRPLCCVYCGACEEAHAKIDSN